MGEKPYPCNQCPKAFSRNSHLKNHLTIHTCEKKYPCNLCPKAFSTDSNLKNHMRIHSGEIPYPCNQCAKVFSVSSYLKKHLRINSGEKLYPRNQCPNAFIHWASTPLPFIYHLSCSSHRKGLFIYLMIQNWPSLYPLLLSCNKVWYFTETLLSSPPTVIKW